MTFLLPDDFHSEVILSSLQPVLCREAAVNHLPVHHYCAEYIFSDLLESLGSAEAAAGDGQLCTIILLHIKRLNKPSLLFSFL